MKSARRITAIAAAGVLAAVALSTSSNAVGAGDARVARTATDSVAAAVGGDHSGDTVYVVGKAKDGTTTVTIYDPATGVTPDQLRDKLRTSGVRGVLDKGQQPPTTQPGRTAQQDKLLACLTFGSAVEWCNHRWTYGGYADPQIYFLDHTSAAWPVTSAVSTWNLSVGIDSYYRWYTLGCPGGGTHCVNVYNGAYGATGWYGLTTWTPGTQGPVTVQLNDSYPLTVNQHRTIACHELGHALSLNHNTSTSSCLFSGTYISLVPNASDFGLLPLIYP